jgi:toxoflavin synthase
LFNFLNLIGDVKGKTVLDLACGEGRFTREIKKRGARHVVGVDNSDAMIGLARTIERKNPVGGNKLPTITRKYGYTVKSPLPLHEGDPVEYSSFTDRCSFTLVNYHWSRKTYERMLRKSGFTEITWQTPIVSQRGMEKYGVGFWKDFLKEPNFVCIGCA